MFIVLIMSVILGFIVCLFCFYYVCYSKVHSVFIVFIMSVIIGFIVCLLYLLCLLF